MRRFSAIVSVAAGLVAAWPALAQPHAPDPAAADRFDGHKVVRVRIGSARDLQVMLALSSDPWSHELRVGENDFRIPPEAVPALDESGLRYEVLINNVQALIDAESDRLRQAAPAADGEWFSDYKSLAQVSACIDALVALRPDLAQRIELGNSLEGRPISGLRITSGARGQGHGCKPGFVLNSCQHAREWISVMVNMYTADALVRRYDTDPAIKTLVDNVEFLIIPVVNPDGYAYTWTSNRLWRKNRRNNGNGTFGVDTNRNWGHHWGPGYGSGSSGTPASETYRGAAAFSEPETQRMRDFALARPGIRGHNDIHSYGQYILWPWGYTDALPPDQPSFASIAAAMRDRIFAVFGRPFTPGPVYTALYPANGVAVDWFYGDRGAISFSYELRDTGQAGFILPPAQIIPSCEEALPATLYHAERVMQRYPFRTDVNGDCRHNAADFVAYLQLFAAGAPDADIDDSGSLNVADFTAFLYAFAAGR